MRRWLAALVPLLLLCAIPFAGGARAEIGPTEGITVSGDHLHRGGADLAAPLVGFVDSTVLVFAVKAHCEGQSTYWGYNMNFPSPDMDSGPLDCDTLLELWHQFFWLSEHYGFDLVRLGAMDAWGTEALYRAMQDHPAEFGEVLDVMLHEAAEHGVYVELTMAGTQAYPSYLFGKGTNPLDQTSTAFAEYVRYANQVINATENCTEHYALFAYDAWNEPDHNAVDSAYWTSRAHFHGWAENVSARLCPATTHIVDMGVAGYGTLGAWSQSSFENMTGGTGFDIAHWHFYASAEDAYLVTDPIAWAAACGVPLLVGEVARNDVYPLVRWTWYETSYYAAGGEALCSMVLRGTSSYPFVGTVPGDEEDGGTQTGPEPYPQPDGGGGGGGSSDPPEEEPPIVQAAALIPPELIAGAGALLMAWAVLAGGPNARLKFVIGAGLVIYVLVVGGMI